MNFIKSLLVKITIYFKLFIKNWDQSWTWTLKIIGVEKSYLIPLIFIFTPHLWVKKWLTILIYSTISRNRCMYFMFISNLDLQIKLSKMPGQIGIVSYFWFCSTYWVVHWNWNELFAVTVWRFFFLSSLCSYRIVCVRLHYNAIVEVLYSARDQSCIYKVL